MILPRRIYDLGLSHKAVAVYCYLANCADKNEECYPSVRRISEDLKLSKCTVLRGADRERCHLCTRSSNCSTFSFCYFTVPICVK